jgi:geranylgeranyl diphosphate synthase type II
LNSKQLGKYLEVRRSAVNRELRALVHRGEPPIIFSPLRHTVASGGKRLRALLTLLACEAVGGPRRVAIHAAVAIECLHNFTLIHDDVMDDSPVRRGRQTVHAKWNESVAILAGDQLIALGYCRLLKGGTRHRDVLRIFTRAFRDVCEGQGYDMDFESRKRVSMREYRTMIDKKTARVIAAATEIGAVLGGGTRTQIASLRAFGGNLGMAFQVRDDLLDVTGTPGKFGKTS